MTKKSTKLDKEDKAMNKINNKYELVAYLFRYRLKELLAFAIVILIGLVTWLVLSGTTPEDVKAKVDVKVNEIPGGE